MVGQPPYANFSETTGKPGRTTALGDRPRPDGSNNIQYMEPSTIVLGYDPTRHVPSAKLTFYRSFLKSTSSRHDVFPRGGGGNGQAQGQLVSYPPKSAGPFPNQHLEWECSHVETPSAAWGAPSNSTQLPNFASGANHPSPRDSHGLVYLSWATASTWPGHSTSGMEEPLAGFDAIQSLDNWLWGFGQPASAWCSL